MRVNTDQRLGLADLEVVTSVSELDTVGALVDWETIDTLLSPLGGDYRRLSLFNQLCYHKKVNANAQFKKYCPQHGKFGFNAVVLIREPLLYAISMVQSEIP